MKCEFEKLAGRTVTVEQYDAIERLYVETDLSKQEFVKSIKPLLKAIPEVKKQTILTMNVRDNAGYYKTPNGCYNHLVDVELISVDIATGKTIVKVIENTYREGYEFDIRDNAYNLEIIA